MEEDIKKEDTPQVADPSPALMLEVMGDCMKIPCKRTTMTVMAKLSAVACNPSDEGQDSRAPITICAAIDRSGSMQPHLPLLKETLLFMVQQLRPKDQLCLVTFDNKVRRKEHLGGTGCFGREGGRERGRGREGGGREERKGGEGGRSSITKCPHS